MLVYQLKCLIRTSQRFVASPTTKRLLVEAQEQFGWLRHDKWVAVLDALRAHAVVSDENW